MISCPIEMDKQNGLHVLDWIQGGKENKVSDAVSTKEE